MWLLYALSGAAAFAAVYLKGWRITLAIIAGTMVTVAGWVIMFRLAPEEQRPEWITLHLTLNASFAMIFAGAGAAVAAFLRHRATR